MSSREAPPPFALFRMITGYYVSQALYVAARLGIADRLAGGPRDVEALAHETETHAPSLRRVLRLLVSVEVFTEDDDGRFGLAPLGAGLRSEGPDSMHAAALLFGGMTQRAWGELLHSVKTGETAFRKVFGMDPFEYLGAHPEEGANFDAAMANFSGRIGAAVAAGYDFSAFRRIVDVGGGNGALLGCILEQHPAVRGVLFELPQVTERARAYLRERGLLDRCEVVGGDFFREVPAGANAYVLKHVIHDWNDERATEILRACRRAMEPGARLLLVEGVYPERIDTSDATRGAVSNDVNMLVCTGGRQRTEAELRELYAAGGFRLTRIVPTPPVSVIEGVPV